MMSAVVAHSSFCLAANFGFPGRTLLICRTFFVRHFVGGLDFDRRAFVGWRVLRGSATACEDQRRKQQRKYEYPGFHGAAS